MKAITTTTVTTIFAKISLLKGGLLAGVIHLDADTDLTWSATKAAREGLAISQLAWRCYGLGAGEPGGANPIAVIAKSSPSARRSR